MWGDYEIGRVISLMSCTGTHVHVGVLEEGEEKKKRRVQHMEGGLM